MLTARNTDLNDNCIFLQYRPEQKDSGFLLGKMKRINVHIRFQEERIVCMCMAGNKRCGRYCIVESVYYDPFEGWRECMKNRKGVKL